MTTEEKRKIYFEYKREIDNLANEYIFQIQNIVETARLKNITLLYDNDYFFHTKIGYEIDED